MTHERNLSYCSHTKKENLKLIKHQASQRKSALITVSHGATQGNESGTHMPNPPGTHMPNPPPNYISF